MTNREAISRLRKMCDSPKYYGKRGEAARTLSKEVGSPWRYLYFLPRKCKSENLDKPITLIKSTK